MPAFRIGHPAYAWPNSPALCPSYSEALRILLMRKVPIKRAHQALRAAADGQFACCASGSCIVEVIAIHNR